MRNVSAGLWRWLALVLIGAGIGLGVGNSAKLNTKPDAPPQDAMSLDRRITAIEQRLYPLESNVRRLEQQTSSLNRPMPSQPSQPTLRDPEIDRLRSEIELLRVRIRELECGLVRVDERTLTPAAKEARRRAAGPPSDTCRTNVEAPIQLSMRQ